MGEIAYNRERLRRAMRWMRAHPRRFLELTLARGRIFWFGWWGDPETAWIFTLTTALASVGAWFMWHSNHREVLRMFGAVWILYPLTYYVVQYLPRYRVPIWWTVLLAAAYGGGRLLEKLVQGSRPAQYDFSRL
jgi:hypothetical protein